MTKSKKIKLPPSIISEFRINGLHGEKNAILRFRDGVKVIVADNGSGKTTLLSTLYAVLEGNLLKLAWLNFSEIVIRFSNGEEIVLTKAEFPNPMEWVNSEHPFVEETKRIFGGQVFSELAMAVERSGDDEEFRSNLSPNLQRSVVMSPYSTIAVFRQLREVRDTYFSRDRKAKTLSRDKWQHIRKNFPLSTIYMPTYRRVEEDIRSLGLSNRLRRDRQSEERHIYFGMADVKETFDRVTNEIRQSTAHTFRTVSSKVIDELLEGGISSANQVDISRLKDQDAINLVLKRLGKDLPRERLSQLNGFIKHPSEVDSDGRMLLYLLNNFFGIYEAQIENDRKIKAFVEVANRYLVDKALVYDEVNITIAVFSKFSSRPIDLEKLSSGEKQLISILSRLYLSSSENFAVIIDEPELSLSIDWQRTLLPDLLRSEKCKFLLAATHSPFIFENELEKSTSTLIVEPYL